MKERILNSLNHPKELEALYHENKNLFKKSFQSLYPEMRHDKVAQFWFERLNYQQKEISWGTKSDILFMLILAFAAGLIAKIPQFFPINEEFFYPRNLSFIVFPVLSIFYARINQIPFQKLIYTVLAFTVSALYINLLPNNEHSDTLILAYIHLPLFLWTVLGFSYTGNSLSNLSGRIEFLRFNGDLVVMSTVIMIAGGILSGVTIGLFELINLRIEDFYFEYIAIWGIAAVPVVAAYLIQYNPALVKNVSPVIARVFSPLVFIMLIAYLSAMIYTGKDPYNDRDFLLIFNLLLICVMAIILFSLSEILQQEKPKYSLLLLFFLSVLTIIVNGIALSAILFRIFEWGITPNRLAVLGGNVLMLSHLLIVTYRIFISFKQNEKEKVEISIARFMPVYAIWTVVVTFLFPLVFQFE